MKKTMCLIFLWLVPIFFVPQVESSNKAMTVLWPEIKPYQSGYLRVSDIHRIYYEVSGNPKGCLFFSFTADRERHLHLACAGMRIPKNS
jgi:hypothetical protein